MSGAFPTQATYAGAASGSASAQSITLPNEAALADILGVPITWVPSTANTGALTLAVNSGTATAVQKPTGSGLAALAGGEMQSGQPVMTMYNGTVHVLLTTVGRQFSIPLTIDGEGSNIVAGHYGSIQVPCNCTIKAWTIINNASGSITIDVDVANISGYAGPGSSITASATPATSSAFSATSSTLTGWTTALTATQVIDFNVTGTPTVTRSTISLLMEAAGS
jgi:hypothetical protein